MLRLIDDGGFVAGGQTLFTYAHPWFWAPYSIVGDGGRSAALRASCKAAEAERYADLADEPLSSGIGPSAKFLAHVKKSLVTGVIRTRFAYVVFFA
jgi:hypothetical protein